jgi:hypothetical protein
MRAYQDWHAGRAAGDDVTASEIAAYAYCAKAWHLERVLDARPSETAARIRAAGNAHHARHGSSVRVGGWLGRHSRWAIPGLLLLAILLGALALLLS